MSEYGFTLFDTQIGHCGVIWGERGLVGVQLPEGSKAQTHGRVLRRFPAAHESSPPPDVGRAIESIVALLRGEPSDLSMVAIDLDRVPPFHRSVYEVARAIPPGATLTYGEVAVRLGEPSGARAVGQALGRNPLPIVVPCHRVLAAGGKLGGFSATGGVGTKRRLLAIEGFRPEEAPTLFDHA